MRPERAPSSSPTPFLLALARWAGRQGLGRDAGLFLKLNWEPGAQGKATEGQQGLEAPGKEALMLSWVGVRVLRRSDVGQDQAAEPQPSKGSTRHDNLLSASKIPTHITSLKSSSADSTIPAPTQPLHLSHLK